MSTRRARSAQRTARQHLERLATEIDALPADAAEIEQAMSCLVLGAGAVEMGETPEQIAGGGQLAIAGLHLVRRARVAMGTDPGPQLPALALAPRRSRGRAHYYPGSRAVGPTADAEWPIPAGWYSDPWWRAVMTTGKEGAGPGLGLMMLFDDEFPS